MSPERANYEYMAREAVKLFWSGRVEAIGAGPADVARAGFRASVGFPEGLPTG